MSARGQRVGQGRGRGNLEALGLSPWLDHLPCHVCTPLMELPPLYPPMEQPPLQLSVTEADVVSCT